MLFPYPHSVLPALVFAIRVLTADFEEAVPGATLKPYMGYRTHSEQADLYAQGRTRPGPILTKAKPGQSQHNTGRAVDIVIVCKGRDQWSVKADCDGDGVSDYLEMGKLAERLGLEWGGRWQGMPDAVHLEMKGGVLGEMGVYKSLNIGPLLINSLKHFTAEQQIAASTTGI